MAGVRWVVGIGALLVGCGAGGAEPVEGPEPGATEGEPRAAEAAERPAGMPEGSVVVWRLSQGLWGSEDLTVAGDGTARYSFTPAVPERQEAIEGTAQLSPSDLAALRDAVRAESVCSLDRSRPGIPDEAVTYLAMDLDGPLRCGVEVWSDDWRSRAPRTHGIVRSWIERASGP